MTTAQKVFEAIDRQDLSRFAGMADKEFEHAFGTLLYDTFGLNDAVEYQPNGIQNSPDFRVLGVDIDLKGTKAPNGLGMWNSHLPKPTAIYVIANRNGCHLYWGRELFPDTKARARLNKDIHKIQKLCRNVAKREFKLQQRPMALNGKYWGIFPRIAFEMKFACPKGNPEMKEY
jgi:hypothetical protein